MTSTAMQVGTAVGLAVLVAATNGGAHSVDGDGLRLAVLLAGAGIVLGVLAAFALRPQTARADAVPAGG